MADTIEKTTSHKLVAIAYMVGGTFGAITTLPQINGAALDLMSALAWLLIIAQIGASIYGGWQYWCSRPIGFQVLYWLSWSCVPLITFPILSYYCAIGFGAFPVVSIGPGNFGVNFYFRFGYDSEVYFNPGTQGITLGVNLIAMAFLTSISNAMKIAKVPSWPLATRDA
jgi:hypothetical protein